MDLIGIDFETYYDKDYTIKKMTSEEYIRDPRFEVVLVSVLVNNEEPRWTTGTHAEIKAWLSQFNWTNAMCVGHNLAEFDALILTEVFNIRAKFWQCTLAMARAIGHGKQSFSLATLAKQYGLPDKGTEIHNALGKRRADFTRAELYAYAEYCCHDTWLCVALYRIFVRVLPTQERAVVSWFCRMFAEPRLALDRDLILQVQEYTRVKKQLLLDAVARDMGLPNSDGVQKALRSDATFAKYLQSLGVTPEEKLSIKKSATAGKDVWVWAFAKTDEFMEGILEDTDERVATAAAARVGVKTSIIESRIARFEGIATRGLLPAPYSYGKTHTHRAAGAGKINLQNMGRNEPVDHSTPIGAPIMKRDEVYTLAAHHPDLPMCKIRDAHGKLHVVKHKQVKVAGLRDCIVAPHGKRIVVVDSAAIELRVGHMFAGQLDTIDAIRAGVSMYESFASDFYGHEINKNDHPMERNHGKVAMLQLQYQAGWKSFMKQARLQAGVVLDEEQSKATVATYRGRFQAVKGMWYRCQDMIKCMYTGEEQYIDQWGLCRTGKNKIVLPNGLEMIYSGLHQQDGEYGREWVYYDKEERKQKRLYGGVVFENICQALARIIVFEQSVKIERRWGNKYDTGVCLTSHDEAGAVVYEQDAEACLEHMLYEMAQSPKWWPELPLACEGSIAVRYGAAK